MKEYIIAITLIAFMVWGFMFTAKQVVNRPWVEKSYTRMEVVKIKETDGKVVDPHSSRAKEILAGKYHVVWTK